MTIMRRSAAGFTLIELVVVIVIVTILSAFAIARINTQGFDTEGFANRVAAMVRYAQKTAISQRRDVHVVISSNMISLCYVVTDCGTPAAASPVREPPGTNAFSYSAPTGVGIGNSTFSFNALGRPYDSLGVPIAGTLSITVTGDAPRTITIAAETGFVQYVP